MDNTIARGRKEATIDNHTAPHTTTRGCPSPSRTELPHSTPTLYVHRNSASFTTMDAVAVANASSTCDGRECVGGGGLASVLSSGRKALRMDTCCAMSTIAK